jgi:tRNA (cytidine/uridine-2'-O-)-methyltransferase
VLESFSNEHVIRLPMLASSRSLNLANAVAIVVYEAWRQCGFQNAVAPSTRAAEPSSD